MSMGLRITYGRYQNCMNPQLKDWLIAGTIVAASMALPVWLAAAIKHSHTEGHDSDVEETTMPLTSAENKHALQLVLSICAPCHGEHLEGKLGTVCSSRQINS